MTGLARRETTALVIPGEVTSTSLVLRDDLTYDQWRAVLVQLQRAAGAIQWWVGDALAYGERHFPEVYTQAVEATGRAAGTVLNWASVSRRVPPERRRPELDWALHRAVSALPPEGQMELLDWAATAGVRPTTRQFEQRVREWKGEHQPKPPVAPDPAAEVVLVRVRCGCCEDEVPLVPGEAWVACGRHRWEYRALGHGLAVQVERRAAED